MDAPFKLTFGEATEGANLDAGDVRPWELHINGNKLQPLGKEEIIAATMMHPASCEESFMKGLTEHTYHLGFKKSIAGEFQSAKTSLKLSDWQKNPTIQQDMEVCSDDGCQ